MVGAWHGHIMASVNQTRPYCVNHMGKTHSKPLAARHGRGTTWARHGHSMLCVNRPLLYREVAWFLTCTDVLLFFCQICMCDLSPMCWFPKALDNRNLVD